VRAVVVGGTGSGVGKTTVSLGLMSAFRRRGLRVQPFKIGPDFIDAGLHALAAGRPSRNLDGWMCSRDYVVALFRQTAARADVAVVEGVMGLFDGPDPTADAGSTAEIAEWVRCPIVLVVDASGMARSAAAVVTGYERFGATTRIDGVVFNRAGGPGHDRILSDALRSADVRARPLGSLPRLSELAIPERHLGLHTSLEGHLAPGYFERLAAVVEEHLDLDALLRLPSPAPEIATETNPTERRDGSAPRRGARIGVARDAAFQFYYEDNLEALRAAGAELVFWSPLGDARLPGNLDGLYLGGGYPELYAREISNHGAMLESLRAFVEEGHPVYAECGGLMLLCDELRDRDGGRHRMAGILPGTVRMRADRFSLGYVEVETTAPTPLGPTGTVARGHEFHYSTLDGPPPTIDRAYALRERGRGPMRSEGFRHKGVLASYVHLHFGSNPAIAGAFVRACADGRRRA